MRQILFFSITVIALLWATSCVTDNGSATSQVAHAGKVTAMQHFANINIVGSMQVFYTQGDSHSIRVEAEPKAFDKLLIYVKGNELFVTSKESLVPDSVPMEDVKVYVTSPNLLKVSVTGSGLFAATDKMQVSNLDVKLTGSGVVAFENVLSGKKLEVELTGSGNVKFANVIIKKLCTKVIGSGDVAYANLKAEQAESNIAGTGTITMHGSVGEHQKNVNGEGHIIMN